LGDWGWDLLNGLDRAVESVTASQLAALRVDPAHVNLQVDQIAPQFRAILRNEDGTEQEVAATLESMDPELLAPDAAAPGHFVAKGLGGTQVRAISGGHEAFAEVTISGKRFLAVNTALNEGESDFTVAIEVQADAAEGQTPTGNWVPAGEPAGAIRRVHLVSPPLPYGSPSKRYHLIIEARDPAAHAVQSYPFTFRLRPDIQRTEESRSVRH
jgi:hypothetical protein